MAPLVDVGRLLEVGVAVADLDGAVSKFRRCFDAPTSIQISDPKFLMRFTMCRARTSDFELMQGQPGSLIDRYVTRHGEGLHHIAFEVADADGALNAFREHGIAVLSDEPIRLDNLKAFFLAPQCLAGVLVEFIENLHRWTPEGPLPSPGAPHAQGLVEVRGFGVAVPDLEAAVLSFESVLGACSGPIVAEGAARVCRSRVANVEFTLVQGSAGAPRARPARALHHVQLQTGDLEQLQQRLTSEGVRFIEPQGPWSRTGASLLTDPADYHGVSFEISTAPHE